MNRFIVIISKNANTFIVKYQKINEQLKVITKLLIKIVNHMNQFNENQIYFNNLLKPFFIEKIINKL